MSFERQGVIVVALGGPEDAGPFDKCRCCVFFSAALLPRRVFPVALRWFADVEVAVKIHWKEHSVFQSDP